MPSFFQYILLASILGLVSGCMNTHVANKEQIEFRAQEQAGKSDATPEEAIAQAEKAYEAALVNDLGFYAPSHMEQAKVKLAEAVKISKKIALPEDRLAAISAAFAASKLIADAYENKNTALTQLSKVFDHQKVLLEINADAVHPKLYRKAVNKLEGLIRDIEGGLLAEVKDNEAKVLGYFAYVEVETMKATYLNKAIEKLDEAESIDAEDFAEVSYEKAEEAIDYASDFIENNYRDRENVKRLSHKAYTQAMRAYYIAEESAKIVEIDEEEAEQYILYVESLLQRINEEAGVSDIEAMPLREQSRSLAEAFKAGATSITTSAVESAVVPSQTSVPEAPIQENTPSLYVEFDEEVSEE
ncbi:Uncharacterised protein [Zhongshania aliphaticivorans]|uniref:Uncharacterized protein n=1 Tax=Zhongshania aliphaticivorans TaxID=1470434 RepID=A0A5S9Q765_9GAMM|nr:hypothetical protein [Zhongshania aliphaticivorans]CAA0103122.1 Uncharacterised protein [Zhongshania aliphaticivorans]CAA0113710.1 Uncharacterised protein [Zhongshania aliphaticivorans]